MSTLIEPVEAGTVALPEAVLDRLRSRANTTGPCRGSPDSHLEEGRRPVNASGPYRFAEVALSHKGKRCNRGGRWRSGVLLRLPGAAAALAGALPLARAEDEAAARPRPSARYADGAVDSGDWAVGGD